jgi:hypothetical protein
VSPVGLLIGKQGLQNQPTYFVTPTYSVKTEKKITGFLNSSLYLHCRSRRNAKHIALVGFHNFAKVHNTLPHFPYPADTGKKWEYNVTVHQLFIDLKKTHNSAMSEALHNILIKLGYQRK